MARTRVWTWETGTASARIKPQLARRRLGFSLLELLLTLVIVGLIVSLAGVSVSSGRRSYDIDGALREFVDIAEYTLDEAQLSGIDMGLFLERRVQGSDTRYSYQWLQRSAVGWEAARLDADAYGRRALPMDIEVLLEVEQIATDLVEPQAAAESGRNTTAGAGSDGEGAGEEPLAQPQVVFYSSGEVTPGVMSWRDNASGELLWQVEWDLLGRFTLKRKGIDDAQ